LDWLTKKLGNNMVLLKIFIAPLVLAAAILIITSIAYAEKGCPSGFSPMSLVENALPSPNSIDFPWTIASL
jgi:hypothetical protein